jgi:hypothetical protein
MIMESLIKRWRDQGSSSAPFQNSPVVAGVAEPDGRKNADSLVCWNLLLLPADFDIVR